jgi:hypothetical protein
MLDAFSMSVFPCAAAIVTVPERLSGLLSVAVAVASSSPPLKVTVPVPNAPPLPKATRPPVTVTLPIKFASLSVTKPESTSRSPVTVSLPVFSWSAASGALKVSEFASGKIRRCNGGSLIKMLAPTATT